MARRSESMSLADRFDQMRADYNAARSSRFRRRRTGIASSGSHADYHYRSDADYLRMMEYARDMDRNDIVVGQGVDRAVNNTVQDGFPLDVQTPDAGLNAELWARWDAWANDPQACDLAGERTFQQMEWVTLRQRLVDGDVIALLNQEAGAIQLVEGHRCRTPSNTSRTVVHGVLLDGRRRRLQYWLTREDLSPSSALTKVENVEKFDTFWADELTRRSYRVVLQIYDPRRVSQTRGVTALAPIFDAVGMHDDIEFATLVQRQIVACFALIRERPLEFGGGASAQQGERSTTTLADGTSRTLEGIAPGMDVTGAPGEKLTGFSPNIPNPEFFPHVKLVLTLIGVNLGLPFGLLMLDPSDSSFSSWRGAIDQARMGFKRNQANQIQQFHRPVYLWKVRQWMAEDPALREAFRRLGPQMFAHRWNTPRWPYIEPNKDISADDMRLKGHLTSPRRLHAERGADWDDVAAEIVEDNGLLIERAIERAAAINQRFAAANPRVDWRELVRWNTKPALPANETEEPANGRQLGN